MSEKAPEVKKATGVTRAKNTANWQYIRKVPKDLADHPFYKGKGFAARESLGTPDLSEANRLAAIKTAELDALWASLRSARTITDSQTLSPEAIQAIAQALHHSLRASDSEARKDPIKLAQSLRQWWAVNKQGRASDHSTGLETLGLSAQELRDRLQVGREADGHAMPYLLSPEGAAELAAWPKWLGLPPPLRDVLKLRNEQARAQALEAFSRGSPEPFIMQAQRAALGLGINLGADGWLSEGAQSLRESCQEAFLRALDELILLDSGRQVAMPELALPPLPSPHQPVSPERVAQVVTQAPAKQRRPGEVVDILTEDPAKVFLRDVFVDWSLHGKAGRQPFPSKTQAKYRKSLERYEALTGNPSMAVIDRPTGALFNRALKALSGPDVLSDKTVRDTMINCGTLLNYYSGRTGKIPASLWAKLTDRPEDVPQTDSRDEWTEFELQLLFGMPVWQRYELPSTKNGGLDAAYWVPLLSLFTGARISEMAQLLVDDLQERDGVWFLRMAVTKKGQSLKAKASWREIPLAHRLIDLGLIEYRQAIKDMGQEWLFPGVTKTAQNNAGGGISKWFSALKIKEGFRSEVVFHSFRGSLNTELTRRAFPLELRCKYIGQKPEGGVNVTNYNKLKPEDLIPLVRAIEFPFLKLPKVYKAPAWFPGWKTTPKTSAK